MGTQKGNGVMVRMKAAMKSYRRNIGLIVLLGFIFAAAMGYYTYRYEPDIYESKVGLYVQLNDAGTDMQYSAAMNEMLAKDAEQLLKNPEIAYEADEKLSPDSLDGMKIALEGVKGSHILYLKAYGEDPSLCQRAAVAVSVVFMEKMQDVANVKIISVAERAELPTEPVAPRRVLKIISTFAIAMTAVSALWLLCTLKKKRICASDVPADDPYAPLLGSVADFRNDMLLFFKKKGDAIRILSQYVNRSTIEDVKALSIALRNAVVPQPRAVVMASHQMDEGKSGLSVLLASELCDQGKRVLLVDMDCYSPTLSRLLCVRGTCDLIHYLGGEATLDQIILPTIIHNLFVVDHLHSQSLVTRMVAAPAFAAFIEQMRKEFDYIFFDTPPMSLFSDAAALGSVLDQTLLVIAQERLSEKEFRDTIHKLKTSGNRLVGLVFTQVEPRRVKQYRDYEDSAGAGRKARRKR